MRKTTVTNPEYRAVLEAILADRSTGLAERTKVNYLPAIHDFFESCQKPVADVTYKDDIAPWLARAAVGKKEGSVNANVKSPLKWFFREAERLEVLPEGRGESIARKIRLASRKAVMREQKSKATLTCDEYERMRASATKPFHRVLLRTMWETIRRPVEVTTIQWEQVTFDDATQGGRSFIHFPDTKVGDDPALAYSTITSELADELRAWKKAQTPPSIYVFAWGGVRPVNSGNLKRFFRNCAARAGVEKHVTPHVMRGSGAVYLRRVLGWNIEDVQRQGGWSNSEILVRRYFKGELAERGNANGREARASSVPPDSEATRASPKPEDPVAILKVRLARGEINIAEYKSLREAMEG